MVLRGRSYASSHSTVSSTSFASESVYSPMTDTPLQAAANLFKRIQAGDVEHGMRTREIWRKGWRGVTTTEELREVVGILEDHGWVRRVTVKPEGGGRPSERLHLHPEPRD
jgi:hypothetical protein